VVFWRKWCSLLKFSTKTWNKENQWRLWYLEIRVQKMRVLIFVIDWHLARPLGKTCCVRKCKKIGIGTYFDHSSTLKLINTCTCIYCMNTVNTCRRWCLASSLCFLDVLHRALNYISKFELAVELHSVERFCQLISDVFIL